MTRSRARKAPAKKLARPAVAATPAAPAGRSTGQQFEALIDASNAQTQALVNVRVARRAVAQAERELEKTVTAAQKTGASWRVIGLAVDMTGRGAQRRFGETS